MLGRSLVAAASMWTVTGHGCQHAYCMPARDAPTGRRGCAHLGPGKVGVHQKDGGFAHLKWQCAKSPMEFKMHTLNDLNACLLV